MFYSTQDLISKYESRKPIGKWKGIDVYPVPKNHLKKSIEIGKMDPSNFYLIYDDGMKIVKDNRVWATMSREGMMTEHSYHAPYYAPPSVSQKSQEPVAAVKEVSVFSTPGVAVEISAADVLVDIDKLLKEACAWDG